MKRSFRLYQYDSLGQLLSGMKGWSDWTWVKVDRVAIADLHAERGVASFGRAARTAELRLQA